MRKSSNRSEPITQPSIQTAQRSMLLLCGFYLSIIIFLTLSWYQAPGNSSQKIFGVWLGLLSTGIVGWWLTRTNRVGLANIIVFGAAFIGLILLPALIFEGSILTGIASLLVVFLVLENILPQRQKSIFYAIGALVSVLGIVFDRFVPVSNSTMVSTGYLGNLSLVILSIGFLIYLSRFASYSLRFKLVSTFLILSLLVIFAVLTITISFTRNELIQSGNQALLSGSRYTAITLDSFIRVNLEKLKMEARSPDLAYFLSLDNEKRNENRTNLLSVFDALTSDKNIDIANDSKNEFLIGYILVDLEGNKIFDYPNSMDSFVESNQMVFANTLSAAQAYTSPLLFPSDDLSVIFFASPVLDSDGKQVGVLSVVYDGKVIQKIIQETNNMVGNRSFALLIDENQLIIAQGLASDQIYQFVTQKAQDELSNLLQKKQVPGTLADVTTSSDPSITFDASDLTDTNVFDFVDQSTGTGISYSAAVTGLKTKPWLVIYTQQQSQILSGLENEIRNIQPIVLGIVGAVAILALIVTQILTAPIDNLTEIAGQVAGGNLAARSNIRGRDEIGKLAETLNFMTDRLQKSLNEMEVRIKQRTMDLERRSKQLQVAADVGRAAATIHQLDELLNQVAVLISERFDFYHVGIFLIDHAGEYAVLRASNSDGGKRMLARNHRLAIGHQGIVGYVASTGQARIALDVGEDAEYFTNPDLIHTRSEMALPLVSAGELLGVLDVQSMKSAAFTNDDLVVMQVLADLIAVAIENARLFAETQRSLDAMRRAYGDISRQAWLSRLEGNTQIAYRSYERGTITIADQIDQHIPISPQMVSVPIKVRDTIIGYVDTYKPLDKGFWSEDENELLSAMVDQLGIALEGARLYEASQTLAEKESLVSALSTKLQESLDVETVLRTAAQEIRQSLGLSEVAVSLFSDNTNDNGEGE